MAPIKVAKGPNIISRISAPDMMALRKHPIVTPGIAAGVK